MPNPYWLPSFVDAVSNRRALEASVNGSELDERQIVTGATRLLNRAIELFMGLDLRFDEALDLPEDEETNRGFFRDPESLWPSTSPRGRAWCRLWVINLELSRSKTFAGLTQALAKLEHELLTPLRNAYSSKVKLTPRMRGRYTKRTLAVKLAFLRLGELAHSHSTFGIENNATGSQHTWAQIIANNERGYVNALIVATERLGPRGLSSRLRRAKNFSDLSDMIDRKARPSSTMIRESLMVQRGSVDREAMAQLASPREPPAEKRSKVARLKQMLMGHAYEWLDVEESGAYALGAPLFLDVFQSELAQSAGLKTTVLRVRHGPADDAWVSYGIVINRAGVISDISSWLIFFHLGARFRGDSDSDVPFQIVEEALAKNADMLTLQNIEIPSAPFRTYLQENHPYRAIHLRRDRQRRSLQGRLLEQLVYEYYRQLGFEPTLSYKDARHVHGEIDIVAFNATRTECHVVECTTDYSDPKGLEREVGQKSRSMQQAFPECKVHGYIAIPEREMVHARREIFWGLQGHPTPQQAPPEDVQLLVLERDILPRLPKGHRRDVETLFAEQLDREDHHYRDD